MRQTLKLSDTWNLSHLFAIAHKRCTIIFDEQTRAKVRPSATYVRDIARDGKKAVYGINTGFGALAETPVAPDKLIELQRNLIRSHCCGTGPLLAPEVVRVMLALRAHALAYGFSGVREQVIELLLAMLKHDILPCIPAQGSVGASGDLAPLAHLALCLIGEGEVCVNRTRQEASRALQNAKLTPIELGPKEGLALINGTQMMSAIGGLSVFEAMRLTDYADVIGAMSLEAYRGSERPFDARLHQARPHPGQIRSASNLRKLLADSEIMLSHQDCDKVQDPYSFRCMPQVHGASRDALAWAKGVIECEINSATDNPLVFVEQGPAPEVISGGNFHGQPLALCLDTACIAVAELANISERRIEQLVNPALGSGLPAFLSSNPGVESGFMVAQVSAASLVSENKILSHPASVDSIPSSAGKEDHVSMGSISSRKLEQVVEHSRQVLAIEALVAAQGLDLRVPLRPGRGVEKAHASLRGQVASLEGDRPLYRDMQIAGQWLGSHELFELLRDELAE